MRRCLIAIFALHFFLSVSAIAFGGVQSAQLAHIHATAQSQMATSVQDPVVPGSAWVDSSVNHALIDEVPDLPDSVPRIAAWQKPPLDGGPVIGYRQRAALPPSLDGLLRPPQRAALSV